MIDLTEKQIAHYFHRIFSAVDGLWFMKLEERYGFDTALEIDTEVWKILPKIQARTLRSIAGTGEGIAGLREAIETKLTLEDYGFDIVPLEDSKGFTVQISECPWHDLMVKSGREHLSEKVGRVICNTEFKVWASEFDETVQFELKQQLCSGKELCILQFTQE